MGLIEVIMIALGLAMDAFAVSVCKGLAMTKVKLRDAAIVGLHVVQAKTHTFQVLLDLCDPLRGEILPVLLQIGLHGQYVLTAQGDHIGKTVHTCS